MGQGGRARHAPAHATMSFRQRTSAQWISVYALAVACFHAGSRPISAQILAIDTLVVTTLGIASSANVIDVASVGEASSAVLVEKPMGTVVTLLHADSAGDHRVDVDVRGVISPIAITGGVGSSSAFLLDSRGPSVLRVDFANDGRVSLGSPTRLPLSGATDLCVVQNRLLVLGADSLEPTRIVHEFTLDLQYVRSFGDPWPTLSTSGQRGAYAAGRIECSELGEWIVVASLLHPDVRGYSVDGSLLWTASVPNFRGVGLERQEPAGIMYRLPDDERWDRVIGIWSLSPDLVAVQIGRSIGLGARDRFLSIGTHFLDVGDGTLVAFQSELPHVAELMASRELAIVYSDGQERSRTMSVRHYEIRERSR